MLGFWTRLTALSLHIDEPVQEVLDLSYAREDERVQGLHPLLLAVPQLQPKVTDALHCLPRREENEEVEESLCGGLIIPMIQVDARTVILLFKRHQVGYGFFIHTYIMYV